MCRKACERKTKNESKKMKVKQTLGERISELRKEKGFKQEELAEALGVTAQAVSKWENDISCPDIMLLPKLAELLGVTVDELLSGKKETGTDYVPEGKRKSPDELMIRLSATSNDGSRVKINLPVPLIKAFMKSGVPMTSIVGDSAGNMQIDWDRVLSFAENGVVGKLLEAEDGDGDRVEITVE